MEKNLQNLGMRIIEVLVQKYNLKEGDIINSLKIVDSGSRHLFFEYTSNNIEFKNELHISILPKELQEEICNLYK